MDNSLSTYWYALSKDCPAKAWWDIDHMTGRAAIYRALRIAPTDHAAAYACSPFRLHKGPGSVRVLAAWPAPVVFDDPDPDWLGIESVISWNPIDDSAEVMGDPSPQTIGTMSDDANVIFASPLAFFQQWAIRRAQYIVARAMAGQQRWNKAPRERDEVPGVLMIGAPTDIRWRPSVMPTDIRCVGVNPAVINKELLKAARVPRARGANA